jgi:hypothetical protein
MGHPLKVWRLQLDFRQGSHGQNRMDYSARKACVRGRHPGSQIFLESHLDVRSDFLIDLLIDARAKEQI